MDTSPHPMPCQYCRCREALEKTGSSMMSLERTGFTVTSSVEVRHTVMPLERARLTIISPAEMRLSMMPLKRMRHSMMSLAEMRLLRMSLEKTTGPPQHRSAQQHIAPTLESIRIQSIRTCIGDNLINTHF